MISDVATEKMVVPEDGAGVMKGGAGD
jgi:hypothetical protein